MKKTGIVVFLFLSVFTKGFSQKSLNDYSYVIVPEQFEFLDEKDKYQLNSIAEFLFNKHGFHAFMNNETPNAKRCDGLYVELERGKAFLKTKFNILLKDCDGTVVYRSPDGISKFKEFKKAYQDALRKAFKGIEAMEIQQKAIVFFEDGVVAEKQDNATITTAVPAKVQKNVNAVTETSAVAQLPQAKFSNYTLGGKTYLLRKTTEGYSLYEETTTTEDGLLLMGKIEAMKSDKLFFTDTLENIFKASFDGSQNLSIQKADEIVVYQLVR